MPARILIVEDERITAEDLRDILTDLGYLVIGVVSNGTDALRRVEEAAPDLVLMDIRIKGEQDGTEVALTLRTRFNIPVVYLTAHADSETLDRAKRAQPLGYITKPFQEAELHANIEMALYKNREDQKAKNREELLASTLRAIGEGIVSVDRAGNITLLNSAAEAWTGWAVSDAQGKPLQEIFPLLDSERRERVTVPLEASLTDGVIEELRAGVCLVSRDGEQRRITGSIAPMRDHRGDISGAVILFGSAGVEPGPPQGGAKPDTDTGQDGLGLGGFKVVAASPQMKQVLRFAQRIAESEASTILLEGESGTGKDVLAQFIHHMGNRRTGPFVSLNCAAIPDTLLESELFGYDKGAFTDARAPKAGILELASGGTIFLDEIGEMPVVLQAKLLRVLEEQKFRRLGGVRDIQVDLRVMAATNRRLVEAIDQGKFRLDLYYRLNVIQVTLPALRERQEDVIPLARYFLGLYNTRFRRNILGFSRGAEEALLRYQWPGNVRELRNIVERATVLEESDWVQVSSLQLEPEYLKKEPEREPIRGDITLGEAEKAMLIKALETAEGNQTRAALILGISRDALRYKMKKFNLFGKRDEPEQRNQQSA